MPGVNDTDGTSLGGRSSLSSLSTPAGSGHSGLSGLRPPTSDAGGEFIRTRLEALVEQKLDAKVAEAVKSALASLPSVVSSGRRGVDADDGGDADGNDDGEENDC